MQMTRGRRSVAAPWRSERSRQRRVACYALGALTLLAPQLGPCGPPPGTTYFGWVGVGQALPTDETCRARVRPAGEIRPGNASSNATPWTPTSADHPRATGNFTGTTDQIIQWAACKWGFDEDVLRAQVAKESYWWQSTLGDWTNDSANCAPRHPIGADGRPGQCPESVGLMQIRTPYFRDSIEGAVRSSAYNLDLAMSTWRNCYEGRETWLNQVERGRQYSAGDAWGCIGRWFSGRWYTQPSLDYIAAVRRYVDQRIWTTSSFIDHRP